MKGSKISPKKYFQRLLYQQRDRSKNRGHPPPDYDLETLISWLEMQPDLTQIWNDYVASGYERELAPSLDRKDNSLPYTLSNLQLVTTNQNKRNAGQDSKNCILLSKHRAVVAYNKDGSFHSEYESISEAARALSTYPANIEQAASEKRKTHKKLKWAFKTER